MSRHSENPYYTILGILTIILILYFLFEWEWLLYGALGLGLLSSFSDFLSTHIHRAWTWLIKLLGGINSKVLLSLIFFLVLVPLAQIRKWTRKKGLQKKESTWIEKDQNYEAADLEKQW